MPKLRQAQGVILGSFPHPNQRLPDNPDDVFRKERSYEIYRKMLMDYQIQAVSTLKKNTIIGIDFSIVEPKQSSKETEALVEFIEWAITGLDRSMLDLATSVLSAHEFGFSVTELLYVERDGFLIPNDFRQLPPDSIEFNVDEFGNFKKLDGISQWQKGGRKTLSPMKFIYFPWDKRDENPYGTSALRAIYREWFIKNQVSGYWPMYIEKFGLPFIVGKYDPKIDRSETDALKDVLNTLQAASTALIPNTVDIEFMNASAMKSASTDVFENAIDRLDVSIATGLLAPDIVGMAGKTEGGSYALAKKQFEIFNQICGRYRAQLEECVNKQMIRRIIDLNFGPQYAYPELRFVPAGNSDDIENFKLFVEFLKLNKYKASEADIEHLKVGLGFPEGLEPGAMIESEPVEASNPKTAVPTQAADPKNATDEELAPSSDDMAASNLGDFVDYKLISNTLDGLEAEAVGKASTIIRIERDALIRECVDKDLLGGGVDNISKISVSFDMTGRLKTIFERLGASLIAAGRDHAKAEIETQLNTEQFALIGDPFQTVQSMKAFLREFNKTKAIQAAGDIADLLKKSVRSALLEGLRLGKPTVGIIDDLKLAFEPYVSGSIVASGKVAPAKLETIVRTNTSTIYNQARISSFNEAISTGLVTHYQYSAILDDRTTRICSSLHGTIVSATDSAKLSIITPPRHFNCRSILVPITKYRYEQLRPEIKAGRLNEGLSNDPSFYDGFK